MTVIARAIYCDRGDVETYEYRIEARGSEGYALIHGVAGRDDLETEEIFSQEYELRSMLPEGRYGGPSYNEAVAALLEQWRQAIVPTISDLTE
jgi:hypothetical protein